MTVNELHEELIKLIIGGQGDLEVIANCDFTIDGVHYEKPLIYLESVYYQSGDIELAFSNKGVDMTESEKAEEENNVGISFKKSYEELEKENEELKRKLNEIRNYLAYDIPHELMNEATNKIWRMI